MRDWRKKDGKRVQDYTQDILAVIRSNTSPAAMSSKLEDFHANDLADAMPRLTVQERYKLYRILDINMLSDTFLNIQIRIMLQNM